MMKKIIVAILICGALVFSVAGCGTSETEEKTEESTDKETEETATDEGSAEGQVDTEEETTQEENEPAISEQSSTSPFPELDIYANPETSDPRNYISYMYSQLIDGKIDGQKLWDYFVSEESKSRYIESEFVNSKDVAFAEYPVLSYLSQGYKESEVNGSEDTVYEVYGEVAYEGMGTTECVDYVVLENGQYKYYLY